MLVILKRMACDSMVIGGQSLNKSLLRIQLPKFLSVGTLSYTKMHHLG